MAINEQALSSDEEELHRLGYAQELRRRMSGFSNFAVSFTIISILSGCLTLYGYGMNTGGPAIIVWGWPIVGVMTLMVGLAMAEVCSSFPTAGGLYYWSAKLADWWCDGAIQSTPTMSSTPMMCHHTLTSFSSATSRMPNWFSRPCTRSTIA